MIASILAERLDVALNRPNDLRDALVELELKKVGSLLELKVAISDAIREIKE